MNSLPRYSVALRVVLLALAAVAASVMLFGAEARASAGAYNVLLAEVNEEGAKRLQAQVAAFPDVAKVDLVDTGEVTPTASALGAYDVVVSIGDSSYADEEAWGDSLAAYVDAGGIVIQSAYDTWDGGGAPTGRWESDGYPALIPGDNVNDATSLGAFDAASPLMQGIAPGSLTTETYNTENQPSPGATVVASWADGRPAIAIKGRAIGISSFIGDDYDGGPGEPAWGGNYGRVVVNAARALSPPLLSVFNPAPAAGTVTSSVGGINCGPACAANIAFGTPVALAATANRGFAFLGFGGACAGLACVLTMDSAKTVTASFTFYRFGKVKRNKKKGIARLIVRVGTPGNLVVSGKKVKKRTRAAKEAGKVTIPILAKGKALKTLKRTGKVKVGFRFAYTPTGGATSVQSRKVVLKRVARPK